MLFIDKIKEVFKKEGFELYIEDNEVYLKYEGKFVDIKYNRYIDKKEVDTIDYFLYIINNCLLAKHYKFKKVPYLNLPKHCIWEDLEEIKKDKKYYNLIIKEYLEQDVVRELRFIKEKLKDKKIRDKTLLD